MSQYNSPFTGEQVDEAVTKTQNLGTAATEDVTQSPTDTTAGRLLKVRDFGLGSVSLRDDIPQITSLEGLDSQRPTGFYSLGVSPGSGFDNIGSMIHLSRIDGANASQLFGGVQSSQLAFRRFRSADGGWQPWQELYHTGNTIVDANGFVKEA